jgi:hypothetical protein
VVEHLPCRQEILSSNPSTTKKKKEERERERERKSTREKKFNPVWVKGFV